MEVGYLVKRGFYERLATGPPSYSLGQLFLKQALVRSPVRLIMFTKILKGAYEKRFSSHVFLRTLRRLISSMKFLA